MLNNQKKAPIGHKIGQWKPHIAWCYTYNTDHTDRWTVVTVKQPAVGYEPQGWWLTSQFPQIPGHVIVSLSKTLIIIIIIVIIIITSNQKWDP